MHDLLNEKEFLKQPYNPWRLFYIFYAIAALQVVCMHFIWLSYDLDLLDMVVFLLPLVTSLVMFFWTKKNTALPFGTIAYSILLLLAVYLASIAVIDLINKPLQFFSFRTINKLISIGVSLFVYYIIILGIIAIHLKIKRDIAKVKSSETAQN